ncbi:hypothetical protein [Arthrobacter sp. USHLN218]|uniref:hypothetical protein n=1 Tax=Arthrobacter sp. USHLN218 TaxID=3081232 RepID=UPI00301B220D
MQALPLEDLDWQSDALEVIESIAYEQWTFSSDDLRDRMRPAPHPNMVGAAFSTARKAGLITPIGYMASRSKSRRLGVVRVWTLKINKEQAA